MRSGSHGSTANLLNQIWVPIKNYLKVFKAIIDAEQTTTNLINHDLVVRMIVQKIDSKDPRVRELVLQLLVSLLAVDTELTIKGVTDVITCMYYIWESQEPIF